MGSKSVIGDDAGCAIRCIDGTKDHIDYSHELTNGDSLGSNTRTDRVNGVLVVVVW